MASERAVFLDRDNTIIDCDGYLGDPAKVKLLPGAATALASIRALGYRLIVVSNQSGVARGMFKETDVEAVNDEMSRQLKEKAGAYIDASYYCPYHPEAPIAEYRIDHDWRKPKSGMLLQAAADFSLDLPQCWMIGDAPRDVAAGAAAGCRTILLRDPDKNPVSNADAITVTPNFVVKSLADAARIIVREGRTPPQPPQPHPHPAPLPTTSTTPSAGVPTPSNGPSTSVAVSSSARSKPSEPAFDAPKRVVPAESAPQPSSHLTLTPALPDASALPSATVGAGSNAPSAPSDARSASIPASSTPDKNIAEPVLTERINSPSGATADGTRSVPATFRGSASLERNLEELVAQLRQQNRAADLRPDFSYSTIAALLCQAFAVIAFLVALPTYFTRNLSMATAADMNNAYLAHFGALFWLGVALFFQGGVIALLLYSRNKRS